MQKDVCNIALLVFNWRGHFTHFAHLLYQALSSCGKVVIIGPQAALDSEEFRQAFAHEKELLKETFSGTEGEAMLQLASSTRFNLLFSNGLDTYWHKLLPRLLWMKLCGRLKACLSGILLSVAFAYPENDAFSHKSLRKILLKSLAPLVFSHIYIIDEIAYHLLKLEETQTFQLLTDPIEPPPKDSQEDLRRQLGWRQGEKILLAIGVIIPEKRFDLLIKAFLQSQPPDNHRLLIAGKFADGLYEDFSAIINESSFGARVTLENRWLSDIEVTQYISAADFIAVTYPKHFCNASILFRAQLAGKPALASDKGWIGRYARSSHCGIIVNPDQPEEYMNGISLLFQEKVAPFTARPDDRHSELDFLKTISTGEKSVVKELI